MGFPKHSVEFVFFPRCRWNKQEQMLPSIRGGNPCCLCYYYWYYYSYWYGTTVTFIAQSFGSHCRVYFLISKTSWLLPQILIGQEAAQIINYIEAWVFYGNNCHVEEYIFARRWGWVLEKSQYMFDNQIKVRELDSLVTYGTFGRGIKALWVKS